MKTVGVIIAALALAGPVVAARLPSNAENRAIHAAVASYVDGCCSNVDSSKLRFETTRVGTVVKTWARTGITAPGANPQDVLLRWRDGRWKVVFLGSSDIGCGRPLKVRVDLWLECNGRLP